VTAFPGCSGFARTAVCNDLMLAAGSLAAERDVNVIGRLARGLGGLGDLVWAKVALAAAAALVLGAILGGLARLGARRLLA
jgi:hypothetical protein